MRVDDLVHNYDIGNIDLIKKHCTHFLEESEGFPVFRNLPNTYEDFRKVKVRKRKHSNGFSDTFNGAFKDELNDLRERAIFANGSANLEQNINENTDSFYIFPINGYKFLYSKEVSNSTENYKQVFEAIFDQMGEESAKGVFTDLLRFTYMTEDLAAGIESGAEIILYGIPYYYVIRESCVDSYDELLTRLI